MEYIIVRSFEEKDVFVDGVLTCKTDETMRVEEGTHIFDLGYKPEAQTILVTDTTQIKPMEILF